MYNSNIRYTRSIVIYGGIFVLFAIAGCSYWHAEKHDGLTYPFSETDIDRFMRSVRYEKKDAEYYYRLGCHFQRYKKHALAVKELLQAAEIDSQRAEIFNALGISYDNLAQFDLAVQCYTQALSLRPDFASAYNNLGFSYLIQRKPKQAIKPLKEAVLLQQNRSRFKNNLALAYRQTQQHGQTVIDNKRQLKELPYIQPPLPNIPLDKLDNGVGTPQHIDITLDPIYARNSMTYSYQKSRAYHAKKTDRRLQRPLKNDHFSHLLQTPPIEISNGNGVANMARNVGLFFKHRGYPVERLTNAKHFKYKRTVMFCPEPHLKTAFTLAQMLYGSDIGCDVVFFHQTPETIRVVLGKDIAGLNRLLSGIVKIQVVNGNGARGLARKVGTYFSQHTFAVVHPANADHFGYPLTKIVYPHGYLASAAFLSRVLPAKSDASLLEGNRNQQKIQIILGRDFSL